MSDPKHDRQDTEPQHEDQGDPELSAPPDGLTDTVAAAEADQ